MFKLSKRAQSTAEYAIIIGLVIGVVSAMQIYVKRGMQARLKQGTDFWVSSSNNDSDKNDGPDSMGEINLTSLAARGSTTPTGQYEPYYLESEYQMVRSGEEETEVTSDGEWSRGFSYAGRETTQRQSSGYQTYHAPDNEE